MEYLYLILGGAIGGIIGFILVGIVKAIIKFFKNRNK